MAVDLSDPIDRWLRNSDSPQSQAIRGAIFNRFCEWCGKSVYELLEIAHKVGSPFLPQVELEDLLAKYLEKREVEEGCARSTVSNEAGVICSCFKSNLVTLVPPKKYSHAEAYGSAYESGFNFVPTQQQVHDMIQTHEPLENKALIAFLAQTGQRLGVTQAVRYDMIHDLSGWGRVRITPHMKDQKGKSFNKNRMDYCFLIHPETMGLIRDMKLRKQSDYVFTLPMRTMQQVIYDAARKTGIQRVIKTTRGSRKYAVHAHTFRTFWLTQMGRSVGFTNDSIFLYLMGKGPDRRNRTYQRGWFTDENLLAICKKAEPLLRVLKVDQENVSA